MRGNNRHLPARRRARFSTGWQRTDRLRQQPIRKWHSSAASTTLREMTVSRLRVAKSETRDLAERDRGELARAWNHPTEWHMSNSTFFTAFVVIAALLAVLALILH